MLLVVDIGNTTTQIGAYEGEELRGSWRLSTRPALTSDEAWLLVTALLQSAGLSADGIEGVAVSSVVPALTPAFEKISRDRFAVVPFIVGPGVDTGMEILYFDPHQVGADRIANSVAAFSKYGGPVIVADFGTAITFDVVSGKGEYLGGVIAPGVSTGSKELSRRTAKLPRVDLGQPGRTIGTSTEEAIRSGVFWGAIGGVREIIERIKEELKEDILVVATGGDLNSLKDHLDMVNKVDQDLTLEGLRILYERNRPRFQKKPRKAES